MAAKNMFYIAQEIWSSHGRPAKFSRQPKQHTTAPDVVVPHPGEQT